MGAVTRAELARRMGVHPSSVTRWCQSGRLKLDDSGLIPDAEVERLTAEFKSYVDQHGARLAAVDGLADQLVARRDELLRRAFTAAEDYVRLANAWRESPGAGVEIGDDLRARLTLLGRCNEAVELIESMFDLLPGILPKGPKQQLLAHAITVAGMDPDRAIEIIAPMTDEDAAEKLRGLATLSQSAGPSAAPVHQEQ